MRFIFLLLTFYVSTSLFSQSSNSSIVKPKITYSPQFEFASSIFSKSDDIVDQLENILIFQDSNLLFCREGNDLKNFMFDELFPSIYPKDQIEFHLLNINKINDDYFNVRLLNKIDFTKWGEEYKNYFYANYIYDAHIKRIDGKWMLDVSLRLEKFNKVRSTFGYYIFDELNYSSKRIKKKELKNYSKLVINKFDIEAPEKDLLYYISDRNDGYSIFGFAYNISTTGLYLKELNLLINLDLNCLDKHELSHYLFSKYNMGKFLSEGLAVYLGGSNSIDSDLYIKNTLEKDFSSLTLEQKNQWLDKFVKGELEGGPYMMFFYACSGLLIDEYLKNHDSNNLKILLIENGEISPGEFIKKHLKQNETEVSILLNLIENIINGK